MSVADLFATQTAFNQRGLYQDTPESNQAWKTAFDIANNFGNTAEKFRQHDENMATSFYRVGAMNAENKQKIDLAPWQTKAGIAKANYETQTLPARAAYDVSRYGDTTATEAQRRQALLAQYGSQIAQSNLQENQYKGQNDLLKFQGTNGFDPITGAPFSVNDLRLVAQKENLSPYAIAQLAVPEAKINQSNQVDLRNIQSALDKVYQDALDTDENGIPVLNKEKLAAGMARASAVYGANHPVLIDFSQRIAEQNGWITQPQATQPQGNGTQGATQSAAPVGGIPAPVAPAPQQQAPPLEQNAVMTQPTPVVASPATFTEPQTDSVYANKWAEELDMNEEAARKQLSGMFDMLNRGLVSPVETMRIFNSRLQREKERKAIMDKAAAIPDKQRVSDALIKRGYDPASLGIY